MASYLEQFETLLNEVSHQSEASLINFFVGGLKPELRSELKVSQPMSLRKAFSLARLYEAQLGFQNGVGGPHHSPNREPLIKTPPLGPTQLPIVRNTLTAEERRERTAKGLCFNCDESYVPGHKCKVCLFRMDANKECLVEVLEEADPITPSKEDDNTNQAATEISLHAFSGTYNPRTIRVMGWVGGRPLTILVDSGSTQNFIQDTEVQKLGMTVEPLPTFRVFIGSSEFLVCKEVWRRVTITLQNVVLTEDLFVLSMGGTNVVLGIQWLEKFGPVTTDHRALTMEFEVGEQKI